MKLKDKAKRWWEQGKKVAGVFLVLWPVAQAILRDQYGILLPDFGDWTQTGQLSGAALLAQSNKLVTRKSDSM